MPEVTFAGILHQSIDQSRRDITRHDDIATGLFALLTRLAARGRPVADLAVDLAVDHAHPAAEAGNDRAALDRLLALTGA